jgi:hypothetical protein
MNNLKISLFVNSNSPIDSDSILSDSITLELDNFLANKLLSNIMVYRE